MARKTKDTLAAKFCRCIKQVRKTVKLSNKKTTRESAAIGICVKGVLQTRGRTLKRFTCKNKKYLLTQKLKTH